MKLDGTFPVGTNPLVVMGEEAPIILPKAFLAKGLQPNNPVPVRVKRSRVMRREST